MTEAPSHPFPTLCLRWFGVLTALWLLGVGYWAYASTQREWTRLQQMVHRSPREECQAYDRVALWLFLVDHRGLDMPYSARGHEECADISDRRTTGAGTPLTAALLPRLPLLLSVTLLPPTALFAVGYAVLRYQRRRPWLPSELMRK